MPLTLIDISSAPFTSWQDVLDGVAECVRKVEKPDTTGARVYSQWMYETDPQTMLGKITSAMKVTEGSSVGKIRCWTLGISAAQFVANASGDNPIVGGQNTRWDWELTIDVWGIFEYGRTKEDQKFALERARMVAASIYRNAPELVSQIAGVTAIGQLTFPPESIQPTPMSGGDLAIIAGGVMKATVSEAITV